MCMLVARVQWSKQSRAEDWSVGGRCVFPFSPSFVWRVPSFSRLATSPSSHASHSRSENKQPQVRKLKYSAFFPPERLKRTGARVRESEMRRASRTDSRGEAVCFSTFSEGSPIREREGEKERKPA